MSASTGRCSPIAAARPAARTTSSSSSNGCICCTVADDFLPAMEKILGRDAPPDHIVIETSGLALPQPLVKAFTWPSVKSRVTVDGVVTVVDAAAVAEGRVASDEAKLAEQRAKDLSLEHDDPVEELFEDQLRCADLIVISKTDLVDAAGLARVETAIAEDRRPAGAHRPHRQRHAPRRHPARPVGGGGSGQRQPQEPSRARRRGARARRFRHVRARGRGAGPRRRWRRACGRRWRSTACCASRGSCAIDGRAGAARRAGGRAAGGDMVRAGRERAGRGLVVIGLKGLDRGGGRSGARDGSDRACNALPWERVPAERRLRQAAIAAAHPARRRRPAPCTS